ncbi:hypothetical protein SBA4_1490011 [Candidatus Sulfopaludibacter sp. SbA4]|nr:hypothetical protein SBA4_1490011 [Candidatus Sulfopaludibacter sp. SbA4]
MRRVRLHHDPQRKLLQVRQLRRDIGLQLKFFLLALSMGESPPVARLGERSVPRAFFLVRANQRSASA